MDKKIEIEVNGEHQSWEIVNFGKSNIPNRGISYQSPLIQCILGTKKGDKIKTKIMNKYFIIVIKKVSFSKNIKEY